jgi:hypothetical protein
LSKNSVYFSAKWQLQNAMFGKPLERLWSTKVYFEKRKCFDGSVEDVEAQTQRENRRLCRIRMEQVEVGSFVNVFNKLQTRGIRCAGENKEGKERKFGFGCSSCQIPCGPEPEAKDKS